MAKGCNALIASGLIALNIASVMISRGSPREASTRLAMSALVSSSFSKIVWTAFGVERALDEDWILDASLTSLLPDVVPSLSLSARPNVA